MEDISEETWSQWKKKRRNTLVGFLIVGTMVGIDYSFMFTTLYLYLKDMVKTEHPNLFYGIIVAAYSLSSTLFGLVSGRWIDKTRKIKFYTIMTLVLQIIGCLLYIVHFNVAYPLIGRLIAGLADPFPSVASGEIIRIYDRKEGLRALWWLATVYSIAFMVAPINVLFFKNVDFYIWKIHVTQLNAVAIFTAVLLLITLIIANATIHDCSAEIDLKVYLQENIRDMEPEERRQQHETDVSRSNTNANGDAIIFPVKIILRTLFRNIDAVLLFTSTFVFMYCLFATDVLLPLLTDVILAWSLTALTIIVVGQGAVYFGLLMIMSKYCTKDRTVYIISIICIFTQISMFLVITIIKISERNLTRDIICITFFVILCAVSWMVEEVLIRCMLAKMVPSNCQSFTETIRNAMSRLSTIVASITCPLVIGYMQWWCVGLIIILFFVLLFFIKRRTFLCNIKEIDFNIALNTSNSEAS